MVNITVALSPRDLPATHYITGSPNHGTNSCPDGDMNMWPPCQQTSNKYRSKVAKLYQKHKKTRYFTYLTLIKGLKRSSSWIVDGTVAWPLLLCSCKDLCKQTLSYTTTKNLCRIFVSFIYLNLKLNSIVCQETPYILYWSRIMVQSSMVEITLV